MLFKSVFFWNITQTDQLKLSGVGLLYFAESGESSIHHGSW